MLVGAGCLEADRFDARGEAARGPAGALRPAGGTALGAARGLGARAGLAALRGLGLFDVDVEQLEDVGDDLVVAVDGLEALLLALLHVEEGAGVVGLAVALAGRASRRGDQEHRGLAVGLDAHEDDHGVLGARQRAEPLEVLLVEVVRLAEADVDRVREVGERAAVEPVLSPEPRRCSGPDPDVPGARRRPGSPPLVPVVVAPCVLDLRPSRRSAAARGAALGRPWTLNGSLALKPLRLFRISEDFEPSVLTTGWKAGQRAARAGRRRGRPGAPACAGLRSRQAATAAPGSRPARPPSTSATGHRRLSTRSWKTLPDSGVQLVHGLVTAAVGGAGVADPAEAACGAAGSAFAGPCGVAPPNRPWSAGSM